MTGTASASRVRRVRAHGAWETRLLLRNGEQLLLTLVIPVGLLLALSLTSMFAAYTGPDRLPRALATVITVSVLSSAFTSLAIATAFERRSGALRFLATTPLTRGELLAGKFTATGIVTALSTLAVCALALLLGWRPTPSTWWVAPLVILATAACASWGMALAGLVRAEAVLAVANGTFLILIMFGGVIIPASSLPGPMGIIAPWLPSGALADALTACLVHQTAPPVISIVVLAAWLAMGAGLASRTFRWS